MALDCFDPKRARYVWSLSPNEGCSAGCTGVAESTGVGRHMPRISQFFGIVISMYYGDHAPPHFHAKYAEFAATVEIDTLEIGEGRLPRRALNMVLEWAALHRLELRADWDRAQNGLPLDWIEPLD